MKVLVHMLSYCIVAGGLLQVLLGAPPDSAPPDSASRVARADAPVSGLLMLRVGDGKAIDVATQVELHWVDQNQLDLAAPLPVPPKFSRQGRFELLPNWEVGRVAAQLLPNYEAGMMRFELLECPTLAAASNSRETPLVPIGPSR